MIDDEKMQKTISDIVEAIVTVSIILVSIAGLLFAFKFLLFAIRSLG